MINSEAKIKYLEDNYGKNILPLSAVENDCYPGKIPSEVLIFYRKGTSLEILEEHFFKTIEQYNLFSSRLIMIDTNRFALQYCTDGVVKNIFPPVNVAYEDINIDDIKKKMVHVKTLPGEPLLAVTGIPIKDGILGAVSCSHAIGDGISLMLFLYAWNCRIEGNAVLPPSSQRLFKGNPINFDQIDEAFIPPLSELSDDIQDRVKVGKNIETYTAREYFSDEFLDEMKNTAKSEYPEHAISNNQIMTAFLLKRHHHKMLPNTDKIVVRNPINLRYMHPDIDSMYIGNAYFNSIAEFTKDEINKMSICQIACRLNESIIKMRNERFMREIVYLSEYGIELNADMFSHYPPFDTDCDIVSSNLTHLNDLESLFLRTNVGSILYIDASVQTGFTMLKEKNGRIFAQITSRYPLK
ncbi:MAG: acyltransferase [Smithella sp.]